MPLGVGCDTRRAHPTEGGVRVYAGQDPQNSIREEGSPRKSNTVRIRTARTLVGTAWRTNLVQPHLDRRLPNKSCLPHSS